MTQGKPLIASRRMRALATILFVFGIPWAFIAIFGLGGPGAAFENVMKAIVRREPRYLLRAVANLLMFCQMGWGYALWWGGWLSIATGWKESSRRFWVLAAIHHLVWMLLWGSGSERFNVASLYSATIFMVCMIAALRGGAEGDKAMPGRFDWPAEI